MNLDAYVLDLFSPAPMMRIATPAARNTDPVTSHIAAEQITKSGARGAQQNQAVEAVKQFPGLTSYELAEKISPPGAIDSVYHMLARRLPECRVAGRVRNGDESRRVNGRAAVTWFPA